MLKKILALVAAFASSVWSMDPLESYPITLYDSDVFQLNMSWVFNTSQKAGPDPAKYTTNMGTIIDRHYRMDPMPFDKEMKVEFSRFLTNQSTAFVNLLNDQNVLSIANVDDRGFYRNRITKNVAEAKSTCDDLVSDSTNPWVYLACFKDSEISILTMKKEDLKDVTDPVKVTLGNGWKITNNLRLTIVAGKYLVAFDEGAPSLDGTGNRWIVVYSITDKGLQTLGQIDLTKVTVEGGQTIDKFYGVFNYKNQFVLSGHVANAATIALITCDLTTDSKNLTCAKPINPSVLKDGFMGFMNTGQFVLLDHNQKTLQVCETNNLPLTNMDKFDCINHNSIETVPEAYPALVEGNKHTLIVSYFKPGFIYAGYSVWTNLLESTPTEWTETTHSAVILNQQIHCVDSKGTWFNWLTPPAVVIKGSEVTSNTLKMTAEDKAGKTEASWPIYQMTSIYNRPQADKSQIPTFKAFSDQSTASFELTAQALQGNDLQYKTSEQKAQKIFGPHQVPFKFVGSQSRPDEFVHTAFSGHNAVSLDSSRSLIFYFCEFQIDHYICTQLAHTTIAEGETLMPSLDILFNFGLVWSTDDKNTYIRVFSSSSKQVGTIKHEGKALDFACTELYDDAFLLLAFEGKIRHSKFDPIVTNNVEFTDAITVENSGFNHFCPQRMDFCPNGANVLEIESACIDVKQRRMMKYTYWPTKTTIQLRNWLPISINLNDGHFCPTGGEMIYSSIENNEIYGVDNYYTVGKSNFFPSKNDQDKRLKFFQCVSTAHMFTALKCDDTGASCDLQTFWGNNQFSANQRVQAWSKNITYVSDVPIKDYHAYNLNGDLVHVFKDNKGKLTHLTTRNVPTISVQGVNKDADLTVTILNDEVDSIFSQKVELIDFDYQVKMEATNKTYNSDEEIINLEDHIKFEGVIKDVQFVNKDSNDYGQLNPRISSPGSFPVDISITTVSQIVSRDKYQMVLNEANPKLVSFGLISNDDTFWYFFNGSPGLGVQAFDYYVDKLSKESTNIFVATCSGDKIQVLRKGFDAKSKWFESTIINEVECSKIKLEPKDSKNGLFHLVALDRDSDTLSIYEVQSSDAKVVVKVVKQHNDVYTFGAAGVDNDLYLSIVYNKDRMNPFIEVIETKTGLTRTIKNEGSLRFYNYNFIVHQVVCLSSQEKKFECLYNTDDKTSLYLVKITETNLKENFTTHYEKIPGLNYKNLRLSENMIVAYGKNASVNEWSLVVYKKEEKESLSDDDKSVRPFSSTNVARKVVFGLDTSKIYTNTSDSTKPLAFQTVGPFQVKVLKPVADWPKMAVKAEGFSAGQEAPELDLSYALGVESKNPDDKNDGSGIWWYIIIGIVLLLIIVGALVYYFVVVKNKDRNGNLYREASEYESVQQQREQP